MERERLNPVYTNAPKFTGRNVKITEISKAVGKSDMFLREGLKRGIFHFGYAIQKGPGKNYSFYCPDKLVWKNLDILTNIQKIWMILESWINYGWIT